MMMLIMALIPKFPILPHLRSSWGGAENGNERLCPSTVHSPVGVKEKLELSAPPGVWSIPSSGSARGNLSFPFPPLVSLSLRFWMSAPVFTARNTEPRVLYFYPLSAWQPESRESPHPSKVGVQLLWWPKNSLEAVAAALAAVGLHRAFTWPLLAAGMDGFGFSFMEVREKILPAQSGNDSASARSQCLLRQNISGSVGCAGSSGCAAQQGREGRKCKEILQIFRCKAFSAIKWMCLLIALC